MTPRGSSSGRRGNRDSRADANASSRRFSGSATESAKTCARARSLRGSTQQKRRATLLHGAGGPRQADVSEDWGWPVLLDHRPAAGCPAEQRAVVRPAAAPPPLGGSVMHGGLHQQQPQQPQHAAGSAGTHTGACSSSQASAHRREPSPTLSTSIPPSCCRPAASPTILARAGPVDSWVGEQDTISMYWHTSAPSGDRSRHLAATGNQCDGAPHPGAMHDAPGRPVRDSGEIRRTP